MALTELQKRAALMMVEHPELTQKELAEILGVHRNTIGNWNRNKEFLDYKNELALEVHRSFIADTLKILRDKTLNPNTRSHVKYLELALKTYGLLTEKQENTVTVKQEKTEQELLAELGLDDEDSEDM
jgi:DNA-binding XRE family transcriptional regulator